jgi:hypothetical protein
MQLILDILKNIGIMVVTIVGLAACGWLSLWLLHWGLKLKSGSREEQGLVHLWEEAMTRSKPTGTQDSEGETKSIAPQHDKKDGSGDHLP